MQYGLNALWVKSPVIALLNQDFPYPRPKTGAGRKWKFNFNEVESSLIIYLNNGMKAEMVLDIFQTESL